MQKRKWFNLLSMLVAVVLMMNSTAIVPALAIAPAVPNTNVVYCETSEVTAGSTVEIPILISNNSGIAGFGIYISYDPNVFTPISVTDAGGIVSGKTQNSIGGNLPGIPENTIKVMCSGDSNFTSDGLLFKVKLSVDPSASGDTVLHISYDKDDTINEDIDEVALSCSDVSLSIINSGLGLLPQIELAAEKESADHLIVVRGILKEPKDLSSAQISLQYDSSSFNYVSVDGSATVSDITEKIGKLTFTISNINTIGKGEELFEIVFSYFDNVPTGQYQFTGSAASVVGASGIHFINCSLELTEEPTSTAVISSVSGLANNQGHIVSVPIMIQDNPGLMGYKLSFSFDGTYISPTRTVNDLLFPTGSFGDNIGLKANRFDVLWNGIDASEENGQIFHIEFEVLTDTVKDTVLTISFSQPDTYDGNYHDVILQCGSITIALNSYTETRNAAEATCCENGYTGDTYCKECGEKLAAGTVIPATGNHTDTDGKWESNGTQHWHTCYYGTQFDVASHTGGTATCTEKAKCSVCGAEYGNYGAHNYTVQTKSEETLKNAGTCSTKAVYYYSCSVCGACERNDAHVFYGDYDSTNHDGETEIRNAKEATCCEDGYTGDTYCKECNTKIASGSVIHATGHHVDADGKWESNGTQHWHTCYYGTQFDVASHTGGTATCTEKAKCSVCGAEYGEYGAHGKTEIRNAKDATCCEDGYTGDTYCKDCNTKIASGSVIHATGHHVDADGKWESDGTQHWHTCYYGTQFDVATHSGGTATCTEKAKCSVCGEEYGEYGAHHLTHHDRVEPDYENDGNIEYWTCGECGKHFSDSEGNNEISADDIIIAKLTIAEYQFLDGEVIIEAPEGAIPEGSLFDVQKIVPPPAEVVEKVKEQMGSSSEVLAYYEIRLSDTDGELIIHLNGEITIKIQMPAQYVGSNCVRILQEDETGKLIVMESWWEDEYLCYKTNWLETYDED